tara:strand:+ start:301 stop:1038 length:738 start_codon:yes stop_codon:yes gene_type:complete
MKEEESAGYYAVIYADVLFNNDLSDAEKILCAHISTLQKKYGYCYASNTYFAKATGVHKNTVSKRINRIKSLGLLDVVLIYKPNSKDLDKRIMKLITLPINKDIPINRTVDTPQPYDLTPINHTVDSPINHTVEVNSINSNIDKVNIDKVNSIKENKPSNLLEVEEYFIFKKSNKDEAENFFEYYENNGWKVGRVAMKKWKYAANKWIKTARPKFNNEKPSLAKKYFPEMFEVKGDPFETNLKLE